MRIVFPPNVAANPTDVVIEVLVADGAIHDWLEYGVRDPHDRGPRRLRWLGVVYVLSPIGGGQWFASPEDANDEDVRQYRKIWDRFPTVIHMEEGEAGNDE